MFEQFIILALASITTAALEPLIILTVLSLFKPKPDSILLVGLGYKEKKDFKKKYGWTLYVSIAIFFALTFIFISGFNIITDDINEFVLNYFYPDADILVRPTSFIHLIPLLFWGMLCAAITIEILFYYLAMLMPKYKELLSYLYHIYETSNGRGKAIQTKSTIIIFIVILAPISIVSNFFAARNFIVLEEDKIICSSFWDIHIHEKEYSELQELKYKLIFDRDTGRSHYSYRLIFSDGRVCKNPSSSDHRDHIAKDQLTLDTLEERTGVKKELIF